MNYLLLQNLKEVLATVRKRLNRIEERRDDYRSSRSWKQLKEREKTICNTIQGIKKETKEVLDAKNNS